MSNTKKNDDAIDNGRGKSKKGCFSRFSPTNFRDVMKVLLSKLGDKQRQRISNTPLVEWLEMPKLAIFSTRVDFVLKIFDAVNVSFRFGSDINVPFTAADFSIVLGLPQAGQPVDLDLNLGSDFLDRYFQGKRSIGDRDAISTKLIELADKKSDKDIDDFVRFFILFVFNCVLFPASNLCTQQCIWCYLDLDTFFEYSWGDAAYRFLLDEILDHLALGKKYVDGCLVGLMAWVYEHVPILGKARSIRCFLRLFKWEDSKIPLQAKKAKSLLQSIKTTKVCRLMNEAEMILHMRKLENELRLLKEKHQVHMEKEEKNGGCVMKKGDVYETVGDEGENNVDDQNLNDASFDFGYVVGDFGNNATDNVEKINKNDCFDGENLDLGFKNVGSDMEK